jgi:hypothetical protein
MGMAANMAAIVAAALLEHGTSGDKLVYCMFHVYHGPPTRPLSPGWERELNGLTPAPRGWGRGVVHRRVVYYMFHVYQARNPIHLFEEARERGRIGRGCTRWVPFTRQRARVLYG